MAHTLGSEHPATLASLLARTNWWLLGAIVAGRAFLV